MIGFVGHRAASGRGDHPTNSVYSRHLIASLQRRGAAPASPSRIAKSDNRRGWSPELVAAIGRSNSLSKVQFSVPKAASERPKSTVKGALLAW
jgi:hypothetical protein